MEMLCISQWDSGNLKVGQMEVMIRRLQAKIHNQLDQQNKGEASQLTRGSFEQRISTQLFSWNNYGCFEQRAMKKCESQQESNLDKEDKTILRAPGKEYKTQAFVNPGEPNR